MQNFTTWSLHAGSLQDFDKINSLVRNNDYDQAPEEVFNKVYSSYSSLKAKLDRESKTARTLPVEHGLQGQRNRSTPMAGKSTEETQHDSLVGSDSENTSDSNSHSESESEGIARARATEKASQRLNI